MKLNTLSSTDYNELNFGQTAHVVTISSTLVKLLFSLKRVPDNLELS